MKLLGRHQSRELSKNAERAQVEDFLKHDYLDKPYLVPKPFDEMLERVATELASLPGFVGIVNVGGTSNGSYELRHKTKDHVATDLDFYLVGGHELDLNAASRLVQTRAREIKLPIDGVLNGKNPDNYLDLDSLGAIIERGDEALLALAFRSFYGDSGQAQRQVLEAILARPDANEVWNQVAIYHAQSLSLHHGSFAPELSQRIFDDYFPLKVDKFELPLKP